MALLLGVDIQEVDEVRESIETFGDRYVRRVYTSCEIDDCSATAGGPARALASRFAAKEAVFKILKEGDVVATWKDIEVRLESGWPVISLSGAAAQLAAEQGIATISLSLSQGGGAAAAVVVAERAPGGRGR